jgi:hypothetical protein
MNFGCTSDSEPQPDEKHLDTEMDETNGANVDLWELISHVRRLAEHRRLTPASHAVCFLRHVLVTSISLASLYFLPLALSALIQPLRISLALSVVCLALHDLVGPTGDLDTRHLTRDTATLLGYVFVVAVVNQLGAQRRRLAEVAERQRDELASELQLAAEVQQDVLPRSIPRVAGYEFAARMYPARVVALLWIHRASCGRDHRSHC